MIWTGLSIDICCVFAFMASVLTYLLGAPDAWLIGLLCMVCIDYITGVIAAIINKNLSSQIGWRGILKKILFFAVVAVAHFADHAVGAGGAVRNISIGFLLGNEGISILENAARCGVPVPPKLLNALGQLRGDEEKPPKE